MQIPLFESDRQTQLEVGIDEAGRGCLAGPVVIASVACDPELLGDKSFFPELADSKKLSEKKRNHLHDLLFQDPSLIIRVAFMSPFWVDRFNILQSTLLGFELVYPFLDPVPTMIDGNQLPPSMRWAKAEVKGDDRFPIISAASIVAKVRRDRFMTKMDTTFPGYGFSLHKGYGTQRHVQALKELGPCPIHRKTFRPVTGLLNPNTFFDLTYFQSMDPRSAWVHYMKNYHHVDPSVDGLLFRFFKEKGLIRFPVPKFFKDFT